MFHLCSSRLGAWAVKLSLSSSCQPLFLSLTWPTPVKCVLRLLQQNVFMSPRCVPAQPVVNLAQISWQGPRSVSTGACWLLVQLPDVSPAAAPPPAAPLPHPCGSSGPSGSSLGCLLSITSAPHSAGAWLQGFTPHFRSSQLSCRFLPRLGFGLCFP